MVDASGLVFGDDLSSAETESQGLEQQENQGLERAPIDDPLLPAAGPLPSLPTRAPASFPSLEQALSDLAAQAKAFAQMSVGEKAALARSLVPRLASVASEQVRIACIKKGIDASSPRVGEEWLGGPCVTVNSARLMAQALLDIAEKGRPSLARNAVRVRDGRVEVALYPMNAQDGAMFRGFEAYALLDENADRHSALEEQASFYRKPKPEDQEGGVSLVLGAGNVASIPPTDVLHKLFAEGKVVLLKMSPVNDYLTPSLEEAFAPLIERGFLRIVKGGPEEGAYLCEHALVSDIHITGSADTHDRIVWGPPGPERDKRKAENDPALKKRITSELGNVSPVMIVPMLFSKAELWFLVRNIATQVVNNASFNCNAAKMLVLPKGWAQRDLFMDLLKKALSEVPPRKAYYPGAFQRFDTLTAGKNAMCIGDAKEGELPWTVIRELDARDKSEALFKTEPFCGIISEVDVGSDDPIRFLEAATDFCNKTLWGTLNCMLVVHPALEEDQAVKDAVNKAVHRLRYGTVAINHWPAVVYGLSVPPWGGHPSSTLADVQSGIGFVHNTQMIGRVEKSVLRGPLTMFPKPPFFYDNKKMAEIGERFFAYVSEPSWGKVLSVAKSAMFG